MQPGFFSSPNDEEKNQSNILNHEINNLEVNKKIIKNYIYLYQNILQKKEEKITSLFIHEKLKYFNNDKIDYLEITNINCDSYEIQQLLKVQKYKEIIENISYLNHLRSTEIVDFLQYLADQDHNEFAAKLFQENIDFRLDVLNHFLSNEFWINIYSQEQFQTYINNFYNYNQNDYVNNNYYPQIPYWGEVILSNNQDLDENAVDIIINKYLGNEFANTLNKAANIIDNESPTDNQYNLIYNLKNYLSSAQGAEKIDDSLVESKNKIESFIDKTSTEYALYSNTNGISSIANRDEFEYNNYSVKKQIPLYNHKQI